jgi:hypothetical protein
MLRMTTYRRCTSYLQFSFLALSANKPHSGIAAHKAFSSLGRPCFGGVVAALIGNAFCAGTAIVSYGYCYYQIITSNNTGIATTTLILLIHTLIRDSGICSELAQCSGETTDVQGFSTLSE